MDMSYLESTVVFAVVKNSCRSLGSLVSRRACRGAYARASRTSVRASLRARCAGWRRSGNTWRNTRRNTRRSRALSTPRTSRKHRTPTSLLSASWCRGAWRCCSARPATCVTGPYPTTICSEPGLITLLFYNPIIFILYPLLKLSRYLTKTYNFNHIPYNYL